MTQRSLYIPLKNHKKRSLSSRNWLLRQLNDPYVQASKQAGYRSRAAFKLLEMDAKCHLFKPHTKVLDLGCAPGGWLQVVQERLSQQGFPPLKPGQVVGVDLLPVDPLPQVELIQGDFLDDGIMQKAIDILGGKADVILSDMAAPSTGHSKTDHLRIIGLLEAAFDCAQIILSPGGAFVGKVFQGGATHDILTKMKQSFRKVSHFKPKASRKASAEAYIVALDFKGS